MEISDYAEDMKIPFSAIFVSRRHTGKSVMANALVKSLVEQKKVDAVIIFSNTALINETDYPDFPQAIKHTYSDAKLQRLIDHQKDTPKEERQILLVLFDDLLSDPEARRSNLILSAFVEGRHFGIQPIILSQIGNYILTPAIKNNSSYIFLSRLNRFQLASVWESLTNIDKDEFIALVEECNKDYNFIAIDNTSNSNIVEDWLTIVRVDSSRLNQR
jgi:hypothetical protein